MILWIAQAILITASGLAGPSFHYFEKSLPFFSRSKSNFLLLSLAHSRTSQGFDGLVLTTAEVTANKNGDAGMSATPFRGDGERWHAIERSTGGVGSGRLRRGCCVDSPRTGTLRPVAAIARPRRWGRAAGALAVNGVSSHLQL